MMRAHVPLVLAVELAAPTTRVLRLPTEEAAFLLDAIAADVARVLPQAQSLGLAVAAALFDVAQVLRPAWPIFAELDALYRRQRGADPTPTLIAFGRAGDRMASAVLEPDPTLAGSAFLAIPMVLAGDEDDAAAAGAHLDDVLGEQGLAGAAVALFLKQALDIDVVHARYLTHHDLAAMTAIQLDHAGMAAAWPLIEAALLSPHRAEFVRTPSGQPWRYDAGAVRAGATGFAAFARGIGAALDRDARRDAWLAWQQDQRAFAALLAAHALTPRWCEIDATTREDDDVAAALARATPLASPWLIETLTGSPPSGERRLVAQQDRTLGVVALTVIARDGDGDAWRALAHGHPLAADALPALAAELARRYGTATHPQGAGAFTLDDAGDSLAVPGGIAPPA